MRFFSTSYLIFSLGLSSTISVHAAPYPTPTRNLETTNGHTLSSRRISKTSTKSGSSVGVFEDTSWLLSHFSDEEMLTREDKQVFSSELKGLTLGSPLSHADNGAYNRGIWSVKAYEGYEGKASDLLLKVMPDHTLRKGRDKSNNLIFGEVKALKQVGDLVAAGVINDPDQNAREKSTEKDHPPAQKKVKLEPSMLPVVIIKKKPGENLEHSAVYKGANEAEKETMKVEVKKMMCDEAARIAVEKHILHGDVHLGNGLVTLKGKTPLSVYLIDWGRAYAVSHDVTRSTVHEYCLEVLAHSSTESDL
ncbi:hypothetical protein GYMLUDRAFT_249035 [Collybiopsis luxurians FD-317 M1]|uniref:Protein kinase domain-containing protein n=1 Tax=Collybiopsis luxurians FD-317 M1 TaxID=944289 RepID=A0A0D0AWW0_9AGAR|nr:hypothetical protein GYMLUDRAFT_249035 [Collybiopsis luxurians FD-317 M1]